VKKDVTDKIRKLREEKGLSQENIADELVMTSSAYSKIERGETEPNLTRLFELARILNVKVIDFFTPDIAPALKEPKDNYGDLGKEDLERLNQSIQGLLNEISSLRKELATKKRR
jgi:transcriptional regulator with XRE-family HTH domain